MSRLSGSRINPLIVLSAEYASGTVGGTINAGAWATRPINVKGTDTAGICTLSSNQFTLPPGSYKFLAALSILTTTYAAARLYSVTDAAMILQGGNLYTNNGASHGAPIVLQGYFTLAASKTLRLENQVGANSTYGQGLANSFAGASEIYAQVTIEKVR